MRSRWTVYGSLVVILLGILVLVAGCGMSDEVSLTEEDNGSKVEVDAGHTLVLILESNPTTGYRWEVVEVEDAVLRQKGEAEFKVASEQDPPPPGTGGQEIFRFEAVGAGETPLELVYHRPWEEGVDPLETYSIQVTVR